MESIEVLFEKIASVDLSLKGAQLGSGDFESMLLEAFSQNGQVEEKEKVKGEVNSQEIISEPLLITPITQTLIQLSGTEVKSQPVEEGVDNSKVLVKKAENNAEAINFTSLPREADELKEVVPQVFPQLFMEQGDKGSGTEVKSQSVEVNLDNSKVEGLQGIIPQALHLPAIKQENKGLEIKGESLTVEGGLKNSEVQAVVLPGVKGKPELSENKVDYGQTGKEKGSKEVQMIFKVSGLTSEVGDKKETFVGEPKVVSTSGAEETKKAFKEQSETNPLWKGNVLKAGFQDVERAGGDIPEERFIKPHAWVSKDTITFENNYANKRLDIDSKELMGDKEAFNGNKEGKTGLDARHAYTQETAVRFKEDSPPPKVETVEKPQVFQSYEPKHVAIRLDEANARLILLGERVKLHLNLNENLYRTPTNYEVNQLIHSLQSFGLTVEVLKLNGNSLYNQDHRQGGRKNYREDTPLKQASSLELELKGGFRAYL